MTRGEAEAILYEWQEMMVRNGVPIDTSKVQALRVAIEALSAEAVHGEWKIDEYGIYHCPICHAINNTVYKSYCPHCGARMKGGDDE